MEDQIVRKRANRPKTRTGCYSCKARHIKCDEEKPVCRRCTASRRVCQGYPTSKGQNIAVGRNQTLLRPKPVMMNTFYPTILAQELSTPEREALHFFRHEIANNLPGSSWYPSWHHLLFEITMAACSHEPAVAHISAALGSICRAHRFDPQSTLARECEAFAEHLRVKALSASQKYINAILGDYSDTQAEVVLIISLLFFCFELWRSRDQAASVHLRSGLNILYERRCDQMTSKDCYGKRLVRMEVRPRSSLSLLLRVFVRLDGDIVVSKGEPYLWPTVQEALPASFLSIDEAMIHLDALSPSVWATAEDLRSLAKTEVEKLNAENCLEPGTDMCLTDAVSRTVCLASRPDISMRMQEASRNLHRWLEASTHVPFKPEQEQAHILARLHFFTLWYEVLSWREPDEMFTDRLQNQFSYIIGQCERYMTIHKAENSQVLPQSTRASSAGLCPLFSLGTSLVLCVCTVAFKCRNSSIRRRCVELLANVGLQGVFDNFYLTSFVQAIIDMEEKRARSMTGIKDSRNLLTSQIPIGARLLEVDIDRCSLGSVPEFYKANYGHFIYAIHGGNSNVEVHRQVFSVQRPNSLLTANVCSLPS